MPYKRELLDHILSEKYAQAASENNYLLRKSSRALGFRESEINLAQPLSISLDFDLLSSHIESTDQKRNELLATNFEASYRFGICLGQLIHCLHSTKNKQSLLRYFTDIVSLIIEVMFAQADTIEQKSDDVMAWYAYVDIAHRKGSLTTDCMVRIRYILRDEEFQEEKNRSSRFNEQFYLDDIIDFEDDTVSGIACAHHSMLITQGKIARDVSELRHDTAALQQFLETDPETVFFLNCRYQGIYIHDNPYCKQQLDTEWILRWILANSDQETQIPVDELIATAINRALEFQNLWGQNRYPECNIILHQSGIPKRLSEAFAVHLVRHSEDLVRYSTWLIRVYYRCLVLRSRVKNLTASSRFKFRL